ncbi:MAG: hypothetical protein IKF71_02385 [Bacilli bacterium]|nr:hypothetical protein [Bacilli bacterium]
MQSAAGTLQVDIDALRKLQDTLKAADSGLNTAISTSKDIAGEIEGANAQLAAGWNDISKKLKFFSEQLASRIGEIYKTLDEQLGAIKNVEQQQDEEIKSYIDQGDNIVSDLENFLSSRSAIPSNGSNNVNQ